MSYAFNIDFTPLINGFTGLLQSVINGLSGIMPVLGPVLAAVAVVTLMLVVATKIPVVGSVLQRIWDWFSGLF